MPPKNDSNPSRDAFRRGLALAIIMPLAMAAAYYFGRDCNRGENRDDFSLSPVPGGRPGPKPSAAASGVKVVFDAGSVELLDASLRAPEVSPPQTEPNDLR